MSDDATGVGLLVAILDSLQRPGCRTVSALARELGSARATTFDLVRRLEAAGFLDRDASGQIAPGPIANKLGFSHLGLAALAEPAEALLPALRDDTNASVALVAVRDGFEVIVMRRSAPATFAGEATGEPLVLDHPIAPGRDGTAAVLRLYLQPNADGPERTAAGACLASVAATLSRAIATAATADGARP